MKLKYMTQLKGRPPTFAVWANRAEAMRGDHISFLKNRLRDEFGFEGIPMRLLLRSTSTPLKDRLKKRREANGEASSLKKGSGRPVTVKVTPPSARYPLSAQPRTKEKDETSRLVERRRKKAIKKAGTPGTGVKFRR